MKLRSGMTLQNDSAFDSLFSYSCIIYLQHYAICWIHREKEPKLYVQSLCYIEGRTKTITTFSDRHTQRLIMDGHVIHEG